MEALPQLTPESIGALKAMIDNEAYAMRSLREVSGIKNSIPHMPIPEWPGLAAYGDKMRAAADANKPVSIETQHQQYADGEIRRRYREVRGGLRQALWKQHGQIFSLARNSEGRIWLAVNPARPSSGQFMLSDSAETAIEQALKFVAGFAPKPGPIACSIPLTGPDDDGSPTRCEFCGARPCEVHASDCVSDLEFNGSKFALLPGGKFVLHPGGIVGAKQESDARHPLPWLKRRELEIEPNRTVTILKTAEGWKIQSDVTDEPEDEPSMLEAPSPLTDAQRQLCDDIVARHRISGKVIEEMKIGPFTLGVSGEPQGGDPTFPDIETPSLDWIKKLHPTLRMVINASRAMPGTNAWRDVVKMVISEQKRYEAGPTPEREAEIRRDVATGEAVFAAMATERHLAFDRSYGERVLTTPPPHMKLAT